MGRCLFHWEIHRRAPRGQEVGAVSRRLAEGYYRIWEDGGEPVSYAARSRPPPTGMAINAVYTPTANGIYQRLGFEPLGEFVELDFE